MVLILEASYLQIGRIALVVYKNLCLPVVKLERVSEPKYFGDFSHHFFVTLQAQVPEAFKEASILETITLLSLECGLNHLDAMLGSIVKGLSHLFRIRRVCKPSCTSQFLPTVNVLNKVLVGLRDVAGCV